MTWLRIRYGGALRPWLSLIYTTCGYGAGRVYWTPLRHRPYVTTGARRHQP